MVSIELTDGAVIYKDQKSLLTYKITNYTDEDLPSSKFEFTTTVLKKPIIINIDKILSKSSANIQVPIIIDFVTNKLLISCDLKIDDKTINYKHFITVIEKDDGIKTIVKGNYNKIEITKASDDSFVVNKDAIVQRSIFSRQEQEKLIKDERLKYKSFENLNEISIENSKSKSRTDSESDKKEETMPLPAKINKAEPEERIVCNKALVINYDGKEYFLTGADYITFGRSKEMDIQFNFLSKNDYLNISRGHFKIFYDNKKYFIRPFKKDNNNFSKIKFNDKFITDDEELKSGNLIIGDVLSLVLHQGEDYIILETGKNYYVLFRQEFNLIDNFEISLKIILKRNIFYLTFFNYNIILKNVKFESLKEYVFNLSKGILKIKQIILKR